MCDDCYSAWMHHADEAGDFVLGLVLPWLELVGLYAPNWCLAHQRLGAGDGGTHPGIARKGKEQGGHVHRFCGGESPRTYTRSRRLLPSL